jgi:hypothetical protein
VTLLSFDVLEEERDEDVTELSAELQQLLQKRVVCERNLGQEEYRYGQPGQVRILLKITPEKIL